MSETVESRPEEVDLVRKRRDYLELLTGRGLRPRDLVSELGDSRATVHRVLNELQAAELVERTDGEYAATPAASVLLERHREYLESMADIVAAKDALRPLPADHGVAPEMVVGASVCESDATLFEPVYAGVRPVVEESGAVRAALPALGTSRPVEQLRSALDDGARVDLLVPRPLLVALRDRFPDAFYEFRYREACRVRVGDTPAYVLLVGDDRAAVVLQTEDGAAPSALVNDRDRAVRWARGAYRRYWRDATPARASGDRRGPGAESDRRLEEFASVFSRGGRTPDPPESDSS